MITVPSEKRARVANDEENQEAQIAQSSNQTQLISHPKTVWMVRKYHNDGECMMFEEDI